MGAHPWGAHPCARVVASWTDAPAWLTPGRPHPGLPFRVSPSGELAATTISARRRYRTRPSGPQRTHPRTASTPPRARMGGAQSATGGGARRSGSQASSEWVIGADDGVLLLQVEEFCVSWEGA